MNLLGSSVAVLLPRLLHRNGCRFFWRTNADCAASLICWTCCGQRSSRWYRGISCLIRKRSPSGWTGASMSRRLKSILRCLTVSRDQRGRCDMIADSYP